MFEWENFLYNISRSLLEANILLQNSQIILFLFLIILYLNAIFFGTLFVLQCRRMEKAALVVSEMQKNCDLKKRHMEAQAYGVVENIWTACLYHWKLV